MQNRNVIIALRESARPPAQDAGSATQRRRFSMMQGASAMNFGPSRSQIARPNAGAQHQPEAVDKMDLAKNSGPNVVVPSNAGAEHPTVKTAFPEYREKQGRKSYFHQLQMDYLVTKLQPAVGENILR